MNLEVIRVEVAKLELTPKDIVIIRYDPEQMTEDVMRKIHDTLGELREWSGIDFGILTVPFPNEVSVVHVEDWDRDKVGIEVKGI